MRDGARSATVAECRRKSERKVLCSVRVTDASGAQSMASFLAYLDSKGHAAVKRVGSTDGQMGPGAPLT